MLKESLLGWGGEGENAAKKYILDHQYLYMGRTYAIQSGSKKTSDKHLYAWVNLIDGYIAKISTGSGANKVWYTRAPASDSTASLSENQGWKYAWTNGLATPSIIYTKSHSPEVYVAGANNPYMYAGDFTVNPAITDIEITDRELDYSRKSIVYTLNASPKKLDDVFYGTNVPQTYVKSFYITSPNTQDGQENYTRSSISSSFDKVVNNVQYYYYGGDGNDTVVRSLYTTTLLFDVSPQPTFYTYDSTNDIMIPHEGETLVSVNTATITNRISTTDQLVAYASTSVGANITVYIAPGTWSDVSGGMYTAKRNYDADRTYDGTTYGAYQVMYKGIYNVNQYYTVWIMGSSAPDEGDQIFGFRNVDGVLTPYAHDNCYSVSGNIGSITVPDDNRTYTTYYAKAELNKDDYLSLPNTIKNIYPIPLDGATLNKSFNFDLSSKVVSMGLLRSTIIFDEPTQKLVAITPIRDKYPDSNLFYPSFIRWVVQSYHPENGTLLDEHVITGQAYSGRIGTAPELVYNTTQGCYSILINGGNQLYVNNDSSSTLTGGNKLVAPTFYFYFPKYNRLFEVSTADTANNTYSVIDNLELGENTIYYVSMGDCYMNDDGSWHAEPLFYTYYPNTRTRVLYRMIVDNGEITSITKLYNSSLGTSNTYGSSHMYAVNPYRVSPTIEAQSNIKEPYGFIAWGNGASNQTISYWFADYGAANDTSPKTVSSSYLLWSAQEYQSDFYGLNNVFLNVSTSSNIDGNLPYAKNIYQGTTGFGTLSVEPGFSNNNTARRLYRGPRYYRRESSGGQTLTYYTYHTICEYLKSELVNNSSVTRSHLYDIKCVMTDDNYTTILDHSISSQLTLFDGFDGTEKVNFSTPASAYYGKFYTALGSYGNIPGPQYFNLLTHDPTSTNGTCYTYRLDMWAINDAYRIDANAATSPYGMGICCIADGETKKTTKYLKINPSPVGATVTLTCGGLKRIVVSGPASSPAVMRVPTGSSVTYEVSYRDYITQSDTITLNEDTILNINLYTDPTPITFTVSPAPADATVTLSSIDVTPVSGVGPQSIQVLGGREVSYEVSGTNYPTVTGTYTPYNTTTLNVSLEMPLTEVYTNTTPGNYSTTIDSKYNYVEIEFAGARGGYAKKYLGSYNNGTPGKGAIRKITTKLTDYTISGKIGAATSDSNGGSGYQNGSAGETFSGSVAGAGGGGGSTSVVYNNTTATAGGGSGVSVSGHRGSTSQTYKCKSGAGGGPNGGAAVSSPSLPLSTGANTANGKNATNSDAIGYNNGNGYVKIKAGWKAEYA